VFEKEVEVRHIYFCWLLLLVANLVTPAPAHRCLMPISQAQLSSGKSTGDKSSPEFAELLAV